MKLPTPFLVVAAVVLLAAAPSPASGASRGNLRASDAEETADRVPSMRLMKSGGREAVSPLLSLHTKDVKDVEARERGQPTAVARDPTDGRQGATGFETGAHVELREEDLSLNGMVTLFRFATVVGGSFEFECDDVSIDYYHVTPSDERRVQKYVEADGIPALVPHKAGDVIRCVPCEVEGYAAFSAEGSDGLVHSVNAAMAAFKVAFGTYSVKCPITGARAEVLVQATRLEVVDA